MSYGLETAGGILGGLVGGVGRGIERGVQYGAGGALLGAAGGAAIGGTAGVVTGPGEIVAIPAGAATGAVAGGALGGAYGIGKGVIEGVPEGIDAGQGAGRWLSNKIDEMTGANTRANAVPQAQTDTACATCDPCAALAAGVPGSKYRGGAHASMAQPVNDGLDSHHTPAAAASNLPRAAGPAIQMDPADHGLTASNGKMPGNRLYISAQRSMIEAGNFGGAVAMDINDIHTKFGAKYDGAIDQMLAYTACLKRNNLVR